jgi:hypothetical protein
MRGSSAQGLSADLVAQISQPASVNGVAVIGDMAKLVNPVLGFLEAESSARNVVYDARNASAAIQADGSLTLQMPTSIGALSFNNIHVRGNSGGRLRQRGSARHRFEQHRRVAGRAPLGRSPLICRKAGRVVR